jgi:hypothetical protein
VAHQILGQDGDERLELRFDARGDVFGDCYNGRRRFEFTNDVDALSGW